jgi:hypothetical protein
MALNMGSGNNALFMEEQRFKQLWIWILVLLPAVIAWYSVIGQLVFKRPFGTNPASDNCVLLTGIIFGVMLPLFMASLRLATEVRLDGLYVRFYPLQRSYRSFSFDSIRSCNILTYRPIRDYGRWGIRYGLKGMAYNVSGDREVLLELRNGSKLMIGSQHPEGLEAALSLGLRSGKAGNSGNHLVCH